MARRPGSDARVSAVGEDEAAARGGEEVGGEKSDRRADGECPSHTLVVCDILSRDRDVW